MEIIISVCLAIPFRLINPVVVSPTVAAVGLSFYSYGFPRVGTCIEIGVEQIMLVIIFSLVSSTNNQTIYDIVKVTIKRLNLRNGM